MSFVICLCFKFTFILAVLLWTLYIHHSWRIAWRRIRRQTAEIFVTSGLVCRVKGWTKWLDTVVLTPQKMTQHTRASINFTARHSLHCELRSTVRQISKADLWPECIIPEERVAQRLRLVNCILVQADFWSDSAVRQCTKMMSCLDVGNG